MHARRFLFSWLALANVRSGSASSWAIYSDDACQTSLNSIAGENGYPDGVCTNLDTSAPSTFNSFAFITLDDGCAPTIYQQDTTSDSCSGYAFEASISTCYNTSWAWYSIDGCSKVTATTTAPAITTATTSATSTSTAAGGSSSAAVSGNAIAGAVVGSVCGLGIIAAVSAYFFWFRPKQQERRRIRKLEIERGGDAAPGSRSVGPESDAVAQRLQDKSHEMHQMPPELSSPTTTAELPSAIVSEAPGDKGGVELHDDSHVVELPGDHEYRSSESNHSHR